MKISDEVFAITILMVLTVLVVWRGCTAYQESLAPAQTKVVTVTNHVYLVEVIDLDEPKSLDELMSLLSQ